MSGYDKKVPKLRFPGFTDEWEERRLGEVFEQTNKIVDPSRENLELWSLTVENGLTPKTARYNREFLVKKNDQFKRVDSNEFIYNPMNMTLGAVDLNLTGKVVAVSGYYITMMAKSNFNSKYFKLWLKTPIAIKNYKLYATGSLIERQRVQFPTLSQIKAYVPSTEEQQKIGSFFADFDRLITLHQRKLDHLQDEKKSLLQKMFPKNGTDVPEIRFPGFTDAWEQRKLGEFLTESKITGSDGLIAKKLTVKLWGKGVVPKLEKYEGSSATKYYIRHSGQFMYGKLDFLHAAFGIVPKELDGWESTLDSPAFDVDASCLNTRFLVETVLQDKFYLYQGNIANGSRKAKRIHADTFLVMPINVPSIEEQTKIGTFFQNLDHLITLHQRKLDHLRKQKRALLQQMFV